MNKKVKATLILLSILKVIAGTITLTLAFVAGLTIVLHFVLHLDPDDWAHWIFVMLGASPFFFFFVLLDRERRLYRKEMRIGSKEWKRLH
jgi:fatty acid desaturase